MLNVPKGLLAVIYPHDKISGIPVRWATYQNLFSMKSNTLACEVPGLPGRLPFHGGPLNSQLRTPAQTQSFWPSLGSEALAQAMDSISGRCTII